MVRRLGLGKNNRLTYATLVLNPPFFKEEGYESERNYENKGYAVFSSYRTPNFFQYYQLTVNVNSNSDYFTSAFGMF